MGGGHCTCPPRRRGSEGDCREASRSVASRRMITCMQAGKGRSNSSNNRLTTDSTGGGSCGGSGGIRRRAAVQARKHGGVAATRPHIRHRQHDRRAARCRCPRARGWGTVAGEVRAGHRCAGRGHARRGGGGREQWSSGRRSGAGAQRHRRRQAGTAARAARPAPLGSARRRCRAARSAAAGAGEDGSPQPGAAQEPGGSRAVTPATWGRRWRCAHCRQRRWQWQPHGTGSGRTRGARRAAQ